MLRRDFVLHSLTFAGAALLLPRALRAEPAPSKVPVAFTFDMTPPLADRDAFVAWGVKNRGEDPKFLAQRWNRLHALIRTRTSGTTRTRSRSRSIRARNSAGRSTSRTRTKARSSTSATA